MKVPRFRVPCVASRLSTRLRSHRPVLLLALIVLLTVASLTSISTPAFAGPPTLAQEEHVEPGNNILGARVVVGGGFGKHEVEPVVGAGLMYAHAFLHHLLELEVAATFVEHGQHEMLVGEVLLEVAWAPLDALQITAGLGPALIANLSESKAHAAAAFAVGGTWWFDSSWGLLTEVTYFEGISARHHTLEGSLGGVWRF